LSTTTTLVTGPFVSPFSCVGGSYSILGTNHDPHSPVTGTVVYVSNSIGAVTNLSASIVGDDFNAGWDTTVLTDGEYYLYVSTTNAVGLSFTSSSIRIIVNNNLPLIAETNTVQYKTNRGTILLAGYATNIFSGIDPAAVYLSTNNGPYDLIGYATLWTTNLNTTNLPDGQNEYKFLAVSSNNRTNVYVLTNIVDNSAPYAQVSNYVNGMTVGGVINYLGTNYENVSDITGNVLYTNGAVYGFFSGADPWSFGLDTGTLANGQVELSIVVSNYVGLAYTNVWTNYVSNSVPQVVFVNPTNELPPGWLTGVTMITGTVTSMFGEITNVMFSDDGVSWYLPGGDTTNWSTNWDPLPYDNTTNVIYIRAVNEFGYGATNMIMNRIDTTPALLGFVSVNDNDFISAITNITGTAGETAIETITYLMLQISNGVVNNSYDVMPSLTGSNWNYVLNTSTLFNGTYDFYIHGSNEAGLYDMFKITNLEVSNNSGVLVVVGPTNGQYITGLAMLTGYTVEGSFATVNVFMSNTNSSGWQVMSYSPTNWWSNYDTSLLSDGFNSLYFMFTNENGETNGPYTVNVTVDNSAPYAEITNTANDQIIGGNYTFRGTNSDAHTPITATVVHVSNSAGPVTNLTASIVGDDFNTGWDTTVLTDGEYYVYVSTTNAVGFSYTSSSIRIIVNNSLPQIAETNTVQFRTNGGTIVLAGYATNVYSPIDPAYDRAVSYVRFPGVGRAVIHNIGEYIDV